jgi:peptide/nickel transport system substrate-binding protein
MKFKQRNFNLHSFISFIVLLLLLCSCSDHIHHDKKIFHYNEQTGIASLDPAFAKNQSIMWAIHQLYNTLVEVDDQLKIRPSIAKSWELSSDQLVFTFHLRTDVYFHDSPVFADGKGRLLTAKDVAYSLGRITNANLASPGAWIFNNRIDTTAGFSVLNDSTFQLKLLRPFQPILGILSMQYCSIVPREAVEKYGDDFRRNPVGTGPFKMTTWVEGQALLFKKNDRYFEKDSSGIQLPYLDGVKISFFESKATEFLEFQQQRLDFVNDIDASFKDEILTKTGHLKKQWEGKLILQKHDYLNIEYLGILVDTTNSLVQKSPLRLQKIRQAINYGFDKNKMMLYLRNSIGTAATSGFVPAGMPSFDSSVVKGYQFDAKKAMQLLEEAGFAGGKNLPSIKLLTIPIYADLAAYISNELNLIGIHIQVEVVQKSILLEQTSKSQALFFRGSWIADYPDAENFLGVFYGKNPSPPNYTRYNNVKYNQLYEQAIAEKSDSIRYQLYRKMDQLILIDAPVVPLWYDMAIHIVHTNIVNFYPNSLNLLELRKVIKK